MSVTRMFRRPAPSFLWLGAAALVAVLWTLVFAAGVGGGWPLDDAWIHQQLARSMAAGDGMALRPPRLLAISTAPLWTALLAGGHALGLAPAGWSRFLGLAFLLAALPGVSRLAGRVGLPSEWAGLAAVLTASTGWLVWGALSGLELTLFVALSVWGLERFAGEAGGPALPLSWVLFALAALARPEGLLLLAIAVAWRSPALATAAGRRSWRLGALAVAAILTPPAAVYAAIGGSPLPQTLAAKTDGLRGLTPDPAYLWTAFSVLFRAHPVLALLAPAGVVALVATAIGKRGSGAALTGLWLVALPVALSLLEPASGVLVGNFGRYLFPILPPTVLLGLLALRPAWERADGLAPGRRRLATGLLAVVVAAPTVLATMPVANLYSRAVANVRASDVAVADWLAPRLDPRASVAVHDLGAFSYLLPNPILDLAGIASPQVRGSLRAEDWRRELAAVLGRERPDYLAVFPEYLPFVESSPRFRKLHEVSVEDNVAMGGDRVAVFETPWTRYPLRRVGAPGGAGPFPEEEP